MKTNLHITAFMLIALLLPPLAHGDTNVTLYQTSFEPPAFTPGLPIRGQDNWSMFHDGEALSIATNNARTGLQCLRIEGALLEQTGPNFSRAFCFSRTLEEITNPPAIVEIRSSVRLDGPQTGTNGTPNQDILSANLMAAVPNSPTTVLFAGGFFVSSAGRIWNYSRVPTDNYKYSVSYTFGTYRTLAVRVDFIARRLTWLVDDVELGSGAIASDLTADRLYSGYVEMAGPVDSINTPDLTYARSNYVAHVDDYSLVSVPLPPNTPDIIVEQPASPGLFTTGLVSGVTMDFGNSLVGSGAARTFIIRNRGNTNLAGVTLSIDGPQAADFVVGTGPAATISPGGSTTFTVTFSPKAAGARTASLHIASNDPEVNRFDLALIGFGLTPTQIAQQAYLKASNTGANDAFGGSVALSSNTVVIGAPLEDSNAIGVNGNQINNSATDSGAAYVLVRSGTNWTQQAYLKASNTGASDKFGGSVAIDGDTIVISAAGEDSNATGVNGNQTDNSAIDSGAVYVFVRNGTNWTQQAYLKASNTGATDFFGASVALSGDTIIVGAYQEDSNATGVNGNQTSNSATDSGAVYVFVRNGTNWSHQSYLKASNTEGLSPVSGMGDVFGYSVCVSGDVVVVGAPGESSGATGVNGNQTDNSVPLAGASYVFVRTGTNWSQQAYLKPSNAGISDKTFGIAVAISGETAVIGAAFEDSNARGVNGNQTNSSAAESGAAYVFVRQGTNWSQQAYLKSSNTEAFDNFGTTVAISGDAIVVGAPYEGSNATGVNGNQNNNSSGYSGAAYVFARTGTNWTQQAYVKASNTEGGDAFSGTQFDSWVPNGVGISGDTVVVGAMNEASSATGVNGNQANNSAPQAGAAYVFTGAGPTLPPQLRLAVSFNDGLLHLTANAVPGRSYTLQFSEDLANWGDLTTQSATTNRVEFTDMPTTPPGKRFYRVKAAN